MHSVSFGCWTPKLRVIVYDNFNQDVYKKWGAGSFEKEKGLGWKKERGHRVVGVLKASFKPP
ncbi:hypothetical protein APP73_12410 [Salmonella enterica subsp. enterica serovar Muenster]|nr:hypothetical protein APP73_12410 [Salmonella enterica subsp. enterica serovar Oranienburg]